MGKITFKKNVPSSLFRRITSFAGSIQMIFFSMLTCAIGSQGGHNEMAAANFLWLHFPNNKSSIQSFFLLDERVISGFRRHIELTDDTLGLMLVSIRCQIRIKYLKLLNREFHKYEVMTVSVVGGHSKKKKSQIPVIKQQNKSNALF